MTESPANWYWSQRGATLGPVDFAELQRLAQAGSIGAETLRRIESGRMTRGRMAIGRSGTFSGVAAT